MAQYRKKPVVIEAVQYIGFDSADALFDFSEGVPEWFTDARQNGQITLSNHRLKIKTHEGWLDASCGDWIARGIQGELYPIKPDIFAATYEPVA